MGKNEVHTKMDNLKETIEVTNETASAEVAVKMPLVDALRSYFQTTLKGDSSCLNEWSPL